VQHVEEEHAQSLCIGGCLAAESRRGHLKPVRAPVRLHGDGFGVGNQMVRRQREHRLDHLG